MQQDCRVSTPGTIGTTGLRGVTPGERTGFPNIQMSGVRHVGKRRRQLPQKTGPLELRGLLAVHTLTTTMAIGVNHPVIVGRFRLLPKRFLK